MQAGIDCIFGVVFGVGAGIEWWWVVVLWSGGSRRQQSFVVGRGSFPPAIDALLRFAWSKADGGAEVGALNVRQQLIIQRLGDGDRQPLHQVTKPTEPTEQERRNAPPQILSPPATPPCIG
jgi:hypothetical protein